MGTELTAPTPPTDREEVLSGGPASPAHARPAPPLPRGDRNENPPGISFLALLREDLRTHGDNPFEQGFWAVAVHRFGNWRMGVRWKIFRAPLSLLFHVLYKVVQWVCGISMPYTGKLGRRVRLWHHGGMVLGARSIGDDVHIRQNTTFGAARRGETPRPVIEDRVDVGCGACILGGVRVGHDSVIGANAVVIEDVPPYSLAVGVPARVVKRLRSPVESANGAKPAAAAGLQAAKNGRQGLAAAPECGPAEAAAALPADTATKKVVVRGAAWILFGYAVMLVLRFGSNLVLTWFLAPRILGVMALVNLLIVGLHMFSDLGIRQCVIQSPRGDDPAFLRTAWTLQVLRGLLLWFCSALIAWPLASFYGEPALLWLVPTVGATAFLGGLDSTAMFTLSRRLQRGRLVFIDVGSYVVSQGVVLAWVWWIAPHGGPAGGDDPALRTSQLMALAVGSVLSGIFETVVSYIVMPGFRHRFCLEREARSQLLHFGGWVFVSTACMFLAAQADRLVVGRISLDVLGVYHVAATLASIPTLLMATLGSQLVFPLYSRALHAGRDPGSVFPRVHALFAGFAALLATGLAGAGPTLVHCLYRQRYDDAGMYMQLLTVSAWFTMLQGTRELILLSTGRTRALAIGHALRLLSLPPLLLAGYAWGGLPGMILGFAGAEFLRYALNVWLTRSLGLWHLLQDAALSLLIVVVSLASSRLGPVLAGEAPRLARFVLEGAFVAAAWAVVYAAWRLHATGRLGALWARPLPEEASP